MSGWLGIAGKQKQKSREFGPFRRKCLCGEKLSADRGAKPRKIRCTSCGRNWFVFPENSYPEPTVIVRRRGRSKKVTPSMWEMQNVKAFREGLLVVLWHIVRPFTMVFGSIITSIRKVISALIAHAKTSAMRLQLIVAGAVIVMALTVGWLWRSSAINAAHAELSEALRQSREDVAEHDFLSAAERLESPVSTLSGMNITQGQLPVAAQMLKECRVASLLSTRTLHELLMEGTEAYQPENPDIWQRRFKNIYQGHWVVVDAMLIPITDSGNSKQKYKLDLPLPGGDYAVDVAADLAVFSKLPSTEEPQRVIFAAQLEDCTPRVDESKELPETKWQLAFNRQTGFLWCGEETADALGYEMLSEADHQKLTTLLASQRDAMGLPNEAADSPQ
ncbi:hypothetical protein [Calycomorphotria hydatis]|uniref:Uncharacterized protein n=1 Tax=Calycomorphotria hydatis TaxID=2528027 RepID=A0A517T3N8_9PLAN|nr:hypothetical protein [Calycomorphotria hydatis]QDT62993.1 hypothetical protein V22_01910 [Calycomorphotria hydatis]